MSFRILSVGWEPYFANDLLGPIERQTGIQFLHGIVGDAGRIHSVRRRYPKLKFATLSKRVKGSLPAPDLHLLAKLESGGVPTIRSMINGDRILRYRHEAESLGYATLLANNLDSLLQEYKPDLVLATHDSVHSGLSLAVSKSLGIPWVAMAFPVIPENLTGFCYSLTPNSLIKVVRPVDQALKTEATALIRAIRAKKQKVVAYRAPATFFQWIKQYFSHAKNGFRRWQFSGELGIDGFTYPTGLERINDIVRRSLNRICLPTKKMLWSPPAEKFVYYPFHMAPESMIDTWAPLYQNQLALVEQLSLAIPIDTIFVIKLHFSDPDNYSRDQLKRLMNMPNLRIAHPDSSGSAFIENAALVVGIQGTSCLEAALVGKPVLIFGDSPYLNFPRSERAEPPDALFNQVRRLLNSSPASDEEVVEAYAAYLARYMPGRTNDWTKPVKPEELERYCECFRSLRSFVQAPGNREEWYLHPPFVGSMPKA